MKLMLIAFLMCLSAIPTFAGESGKQEHYDKKPYVRPQPQAVPPQTFKNDGTLPPNVVLTPNGYRPRLGYQWVTNDMADARVVWVPNTIYPDLHLVTTDREGIFVPEDGYSWQVDTAQYQLSLADVAAGFTIFLAAQKLSEKFGNDFDRLIPTRGPNSAKQTGRDGASPTGKDKGHSGGAGTGGGRSTGPGAQDRF